MSCFFYFYFLQNWELYDYDKLKAGQPKYNSRITIEWATRGYTAHF